MAAADSSADGAHSTAAAPGSATLAQRMWRAAQWLLGSSIASQGLRLLSSLVLTRLLMPEAFGLVAAVQTVYLGLVLFSDVGVWQSVVNAPETHARDPRFLGTALSVQLARGGLLAALVLGLAGVAVLAQTNGWASAGNVYSDPRLPPMLAFFALVALVQGCESMGLALAQRRLLTSSLVRLELISQLLGTVLTIALAFVTRSVWALLLGTLLAASARTVLSYLILPGGWSGNWVGPRWDSAHMRSIFGFGKWIFLSSIIGFVAAHGEKLLLGGAMTAAGFGVYAIAATLLAALVSVVGSLNAHLIFPSLSEALRRSPHEADRVYQRVQRIADALLGGLAGLLFGLGHWAVWLHYDQRYQDAGWMLGWLAIGLVGMRFQVLEQMMFARAQPGWVTLANTLRAVALLVLVPLGYAWAHTPGALAAVVLAQFAGWPSALLFKYRQGLPLLRSEVVWPLALLLGLGVGQALNATLLMLRG